MEAKFSPKHLLVMLLAVFLTAGLTMSVAQASAMSARMTTAVDNGMAMTTYAGMAKMVDAAMKGDCKTCLKSTGDGGNAMHCPPSCIAPVLAVLPQGLTMTMVPRLQQLTSLPAPFRRGRSSLPDPYPPRPSV